MVRPRPPTLEGYDINRLTRTTHAICISDLICDLAIDLAIDLGAPLQLEKLRNGGRSGPRAEL